MRRSATVLKVLVVLVAIDWWVRGPFFRSYVMPCFVLNYIMPRDRTNGTQPSILIDAIAYLPRASARIAFIGDSTIKALDGPDTASVPFLVREFLRERLARRDIDVVDLSVIGLHVDDAALLADKLLAANVDVIVYDVLLRAFRTTPERDFLTAVRSDLGPGDLARLTKVGGLPWLMRTTRLEDLIRGFVRSSLATYAYRLELSSWVLEMEPSLDAVLHQPAMAAWTSQPPPMGSREFEMTAAEFGYPSASWDAFELLARLCREHAPWRCLVMTGPLNPEFRDAIEPGLYEDFRRRARVIAEDNKIVWRDYTDSMTGDLFWPSNFVSQARYVHLTDRGRMNLASELVEPPATMVETGRRGGSTAAISSY